MGITSNGLLLLHKSPGLTSFESLSIIKKALSTGKVGHTGTLDKFASGLLLVLIGQSLKLSFMFSYCKKEYEGIIRFGIETDTLDPEGKVIRETDLPSREAVEAVLPGFRGEILQAPPAFSAIHIDGKRAHELSRQGKMPEMKKRPVMVYEMKLISWAPPFAGIKVVCSAGTYIRSLARDIAIAAGSCAHLNALSRTRIGPFSLSEAFDPETINPDCLRPSTKDFGAGETNTLPKQPYPARSAAGLVDVKAALRPITPNIFTTLDFPYIHISEEQIKAVIHGQNLQGKVLEPMVKALPFLPVAGLFGEINGKTELVAMLEHKNGKWNYGHVFAKNGG